MFYGDIETPEDAISYAEELYRNAWKTESRKWEELQVAVDAFLEGRETADARKLRRMKNEVALRNYRYLEAKQNAHYMKGYLQGVRDMLDALS